MLTEKSYTLAVVATADERKAQYQAFFDEILSQEFPLIHDADSDYYWLDENKNCGFCIKIGSGANSGGAGVYAAYVSGEPEVTNTYIANSLYSGSKEGTIFFQTSKDKNVIYLRENGYSSNTIKINCNIAAKDENGAWHMFSGNYLFNSQGQFNSQNSVLTDTKSPFIATKMAAPNGVKFLELNKLFFATSFEIGSTLVAFDGVPHRVVSVDGTNPCFTFPVSEE